MRRWIPSLGRYRQLLKQDFLACLMGGFVMLLGFVSFAAGMVYAFLSSSTLVILVSAVLGDAVAGSGLVSLHCCR